MISPSIIPETPQIFGRLRSLFRRRLDADDAFVADTAGTVPETEPSGDATESQPAIPTEDLYVSLDSSDDESDLLLPQQPPQQTVTPSEPIRTVVSDRSSAPLSSALADLRRVQLFRGPKEPLSAFYLHPLRWQNRTFISAEQAYQYAKLVHHKVALTRQKEMLRCRSSHACKQLAYRCVQKSNASWDAKKFELMEEICTAKLQQCRKFKDSLRKSGDAHLLHNTETDSVWGCGPDLKGLNKMGHILMNVRRHDSDYIQEFPALPSASVKTTQVPAPTAKTESSSVVVIGNSNARGLSQRLNQKDVPCTGYVYPGQTAHQISKRIRSIDIRSHTPSTVLIHAGDIEARDFSRSVTDITRNMKTLVESIRSECTDVPVIISGLPHVPAWSRLNRRIADINSNYSHLCRSMDNVYFVSNKTATLARDQIHLTAQARDSLCCNIAYLVKRCI